MEAGFLIMKIFIRDIAKHMQTSLRGCQYLLINHVYVHTVTLSSCEFNFAPISDLCQFNVSPVNMY